jgi:transcriptional regulator with XRE-family HTH domain
LAGAAYTKAYKELLAALVKMRLEAGLSQASLAKRLSKPPSFVGKYELGERRLDVVETMVIIKAIGANPADFWAQEGLELPPTL